MKNITSLLLLFVTLSIFSACKRVDVDPDERSRITGTYDVEEYSHYKDRTYNYVVTVRKSESAEDEIWIDNFYNAGISIMAIITGSRVLIPLQESSIYTIEGTGTLVGNEMDLTYIVSNSVNSIVDDLDAVCIKR